MSRIVPLIEKDEVRMKALECAAALGLSQCYLAAGFVRNMVWDHLHQKTKPTYLNDVDVIYFDANESNVNAYLAFEAQLSALMPELNWQVRNQARMNARNGDEPYVSSVDAMSYWPEKETAVGIRKLGNQGYECVSAFGLDSLFELKLSHNPKRSKALFEYRVDSKAWLVCWPNLTLVS
jgi:hypothetical protein